MKRFSESRYSEVVTTKLRSSQRKFLEEQALARDVSLCNVIRDLINDAMVRAERLND